MTGPGTRTPAIEFEVFSTTLGLALVAGGLSLVAPFLLALTATLAAFAFAGWSGMLRDGPRGSGRLSRPDRVIALGVLGAGVVVFVDPPLPPMLPFRGLLLAGALLPLWLAERRRPSPPATLGGPRP